ncbi:hypothetical protein CLAIMM_02088 isoform 2 [Cladophialophora immunda]|nr:hypothetical protein CLAIMM_02088 isoform 2 [Cladophialophora immunda]
MENAQLTDDALPLLPTSDLRQRSQYDVGGGVPPQRNERLPPGYERLSSLPSDENPSEWKNSSKSSRRQKLVSMASSASLSTMASRLSVPDPWDHQLVETDTNGSYRPSTTCRFRRGPQRWRVFFSGLWQLLVTTALCLSLFGLFYAESRKQVLWRKDKNVFNIFNIGLSMLLGMALSSAFKGFAQSLRWQLLSTRYLSLEDFDRVMQCESLIATTQLLWRGRVKGRLMPSRIQWYCAAALSLNLGLQVLVATLGLFAGFEPSEEWVKLTERRNLMVADWNAKNIYTGPYDLRESSIILAALSTRQQQAESSSNVVPLLGWIGWYLLEWGDCADGEPWRFCVCDNEDELPSSRKVYLTDGGERAQLSSENLTITSDRSVASKSVCQQHAVTQYSPGTLSFKNSSTNTIASIPWNLTSNESRLTWATWGDDAAYGLRSSRVMAFYNDGDIRRLFDCNSTVFEVNLPAWYSEPDEGLKLPDEIARGFAGAISWGGTVFAGDPKSNGSGPQSHWRAYPRPSCFFFASSPTSRVTRSSKTPATSRRLISCGRSWRDSGLTGASSLAKTWRAI